MILFFATQDVRTPLNFIESKGRWERQISDIFDQDLPKFVSQFEEAKKKGITLKPKVEKNELTDIFKVTVEPSVDSDSEAAIRTEAVVGRKLWIATMRHLLTHTAKILDNHRWSVAEPAGDAEWPLTDHPALRLNYYKPGHYDFKGGWGNPGSELMMPISPRHLLYVKVSKKTPNRFAFSPELTQLIQRLLVERAHRWVFATQPLEWAAKVRQRTEDPEIFEAEEKAWDDFHQNQSESEMSSGRSKDPGED